MMTLSKKTMMNINIFAKIMKKALLLSITATILISCGVEVETGGCIDPNASNYESFADFNDGSCIYNADVVFFYDAITANELNGFTDLLWGPIDRLDYYIEENPGTFVFVGSEYPNPAYVAAGIPNCYEATYVTSNRIWSNQNTTVVNYMVYGVHEALLGEIETLVDEYSFDLYPNECAAVQIRFLTKKKK